MIHELTDAVISCKKDTVLAAVEAKKVMEPSEIIDKGLAAGMNQVGVLFERGKLFLPPCNDGSAMTEESSYLKLICLQEAEQRNWELL